MTAHARPRGRKPRRSRTPPPHVLAKRKGWGPMPKEQRRDVERMLAGHEPATPRLPV